jgi:hypothetical protein
MLTLQNILDSDSLSTLVAKINANFQSIALSNGGPQGLRGEQGIPGLPGKQGATGPSGGVGATGPQPGLIPFSTTGTPQSYTYSGSALYTPPTYNDRSKEFLTTGPNTWGPKGPTGSGFAVSGQLYFDNNQLGWWKYLTIPDPTPTLDGGSATAIDGNPAEYYVESPFYAAADGGSYSGPDWYFYPLNLSSIINATQGVWTADKTNYLGRLAGSAYSSSATGPTSLPDDQSPYSIANARMNSKFGTVWISSFDADTATPPGGGGDLSDNDTSYIYYWDYINSPRLSSGIDRSLFKMSIDGPLYFDMMKARGYRTTDSGDIIGVPYSVAGATVDVPRIASIAATSAGIYEDYFARPLYNASIDAYSPIAFYTSRNTELGDAEDLTTLGYLQFTKAPGGAATSGAKIHLFTTRQNDEFFDPATGSPTVKTLTTSSNVGEVLWDVRRFITSNQYLNMFPQDTENFTSVDLIPAPVSPLDPRNDGFVRDAWTASSKWKVFQGYHSVFTGQKVVDNASTGNLSGKGIDQWIYEDRQSWYGSSIFAEKPDILNTTVQQELVRSSGLMIDAKSMDINEDGGRSYQDRVYIYTSNMTSVDGIPANYTNPDSADNVLLSLPVAYYSATRNIGLGTVTNDKAGMFEPSAKLQVHSDWRNEDLEGFGLNTNYTNAISSYGYTGIDKPWLSYTDYVPQRRMKTAAFTIERNNPAAIWGIGEGGVFDGTAYEMPDNYFLDWNARGVFNDILIGAVAPMDNEPNSTDVAGGSEYKTFAATFLRPTAGIRYESFNYTGPFEIVNANPNRNYGWAYRGALRLGTSPYFSGANTNPTEDEIGANANLQNIEYQLTLSPLSFSNAATADAKYQMVSGIGIHNLYPRARAHFYGKNTYQEFRFDEAYSPGSENPLDVTGGDAGNESWGSLGSNNQITIDYIGDSYWYNSAIYDYPYDYALATTGNTITSFSSNARNYPTKEEGTVKKTKSTYHPTNNYSLLTSTAGTINSFASLHGGVDNALWAVDKYIGFNIFRDLLAKGDEAGESGILGANNLIGNSYDQYASSWRIGTEGVNSKKGSRSANNGGSLIMTDSVGRMGFSFLPAYRDGGSTYGLWEQQNIGTREIVDNIKIVFDERGNIGIGNAAGYDANAYPSTYQNPDTGYINYLPNANGAVANPGATGPRYYNQLAAAAWSPAVGDTYGLAVPVGDYGAFDVASINKQTTIGESIRFEIGGEKASTKVGHNPEKRGYGYPGWSSNNSTLGGQGLPVTGAYSGCVVNITDNATAEFAVRYLGISGTTLVNIWKNSTHSFTFDNIGRLVTYFVDFGGSTSPAPTYSLGQNLLLVLQNFRMPHPRDFSASGPFGTSFPNTTDYPWTTGMTMNRTLNGVSLAANATIWIPVSAAAATLSDLTLTFEDGIGYAAQAAPAYEALQESVMRLNNFTVGEGYQLVRSNGNVAAINGFTDISEQATVDIYQSRIKSPKMLLTYGAPDLASATLAGYSSAEITALGNAGLLPLMKVTTVIESAQNESSLRTYTIPKAANTGGSFMVITDHMGEKEKDSPGLTDLPQNTAYTRIKLEKVVAHEVVRTGQAHPTNTYGFAPSTSVSIGELNFFRTKPASYELLPISYIKDYGSGNNINTERVLTDPQQVNNGTGFNNSFVSNIRRNLDNYWELDNDIYIGPYRERGAAAEEQFRKSEIRYRRLNEDYVMLDFNVDIRALAYDTLRQCNPVSDAWNNHGDIQNILGDSQVTGPTSDLNAYTHSPYAPGHLMSQISYWQSGAPNKIRAIGKHVYVGVDARWVQYIRFSYDVQEDAFSVGVDDPFFYERQFGGGPTFANWNEYRAWYPGSAVIGAYVGGSGPTGQYTEYQFYGDALAGENGEGASGYNPTDGAQIAGTYPSSTGYTWNTVGTGAAFIPPYDGSPYNVWSSEISSNTSADYGILRYWNGRINDWYNSRWSQSTNSVANTFSAWDSQGTFTTPDAYLQQAANKYTDSYNLEFGYPGYDFATVGGNGEWQNGEQTPDTGNNIWPLPWDQNVPLRRNQPNINSYAYKTLWKWYQKFDYVAGVKPYSYNVYVEHPKIFDDIISRSFGDSAWKKSGNMQWRVTPSGKGTGLATSAAGESDITFNRSSTNITFVVEVMFDEPLFVSGRSIYLYDTADDVLAGNMDEFVTGTNQDEALQHMKNQAAFAGLSGGIPTGGTIQPHSNLTLRGQAVVKYKPTEYTKTTVVVGNGPQP